MELPRSRLVLLPPEILLETLQYLDYRALIDARQTCRALYEITNSKQLWANLARDLSFKPGIGKLTYPLGNYSTVELMHWTLRCLRTQDQWASDDTSHPLQFRSRMVEGVMHLSGAELLPGGRWLFMVQNDGTAFILDLEKDSSQPQFLFQNSNLRDDPMVKFRIWIDETKPELTFRVATYPWRAYRYNPIRIYQIHCTGLDSPFVVSLLTVIRDSFPYRDIRHHEALSERFFLHSFALRNLDENSGKMIPGSTIVLQLHQYSRDLPHGASNFVAKRVESNGLTRVFFVPGDQVVFAAPTFINIYAISFDLDSTPTELVLLHHIPISQAVNLLSTPFIGSQCAYFVGVGEDTLRRITIKYDHDSPPIIEELGNLDPPEVKSSGMKFGPSASIVPRSETSFDILTYHRWVDRASLQRKFYNVPDDQPLRIKCLTAFDDSVGRIVLETNLSWYRLMVLDLI